MRKRPWMAVGVVLVLASGSAAGPVWAKTPSRAAAQQDTGRLAMLKLSRGIANTATGWMEIPKQMILTGQQSSPWVGLTWGFAKGIGWAVGRSVAGAYEIVTFPVPIPEEYRPIFQPETVMSDAAEG